MEEMIDENVKLTHYEAGDIEIYDENDKDTFYVYFESVSQFAELIKTDLELAKKLKELL